jgi:hypothetical protein
MKKSHYHCVCGKIYRLKQDLSDHLPGCENVHANDFEPDLLLECEDIKPDIEDIQENESSDPSDEDEESSNDEFNVGDSLLPCAKKALTSKPEPIAKEIHGDTSVKTAPLFKESQGAVTLS